MLDLTTNPPGSTKAAGTFLASLTTPASRHTQRQALAVIARICGFSLEDMPWAQLHYEHTQYVRAELAQKYAPATANRFLSAMRRVLKECWRLGYMTVEDFQRACDIAPIIGETVPAGRGLGSDEILLLMDACHRDITPAGARDAAVIGILYMCGLSDWQVAGTRLFSHGLLVDRFGRRDQRAPHPAFPDNRKPIRSARRNFSCYGESLLVELDQPIPTSEALSGLLKYQFLQRSHDSIRILTSQVILHDI